MLAGAHNSHDFLSDFLIFWDILQSAGFFLSELGLALFLFSITNDVIFLSCAGRIQSFSLEQAQFSPC